MKLKDAVTQTSHFTKNIAAKIVISKPLSYQPVISNIVLNRINSLLYKIKVKDTNYSLLLIGHGSSDKSARDAFLYTVKSLKDHFQYVNYCFLELEPPNIEEGIRNCLTSNPSSIFVMPYFLHKGIHIQKDILIDINKALEKYDFSNLYIAEHIGVDPSIIELVISLAKDAENKSGLF
jgi:precorrin-8X/cobalt-precorrin-8 methylmutase